MILFTKKAQKELAKYEKQHPGEVFQAVVTRDRARLLVSGERWEFVVEGDELLLATHETDRTFVPDALYRLAFCRALEGIAAVRAGHREALKRRREKMITRTAVRSLQRALPLF